MQAVYKEMLYGKELHMTVSKQAAPRLPREQHDYGHAPMYPDQRPAGCRPTSRDADDVRPVTHGFLYEFLAFHLQNFKSVELPLSKARRPAFN